MEELLARIVDSARRNATGQNIDDASCGGKLNLSPNFNDARPDVWGENRGRRRSCESWINSGRPVFDGPILALKNVCRIAGQMPASDGVCDGGLVDERCAS